MEQLALSNQLISTSEKSRQTAAERLVVLISFVWLGFFSAISFMEAPTKFRAPHLSLSVGVEVGRIVFQTSQLVQWIFCVSLLLSIWRTGRLFAALWKWCGGLILIMLLETFWLFPALDRQAQQVIQGHVLPMTAVHWIFVVFELFKIPCLFFIGWKSMHFFSRTSTSIVSH